MNNSEKADFLKNTIEILFSKEGRSKSYISRILGIDRHTLAIKINKEWNLPLPNPKRHLSPSNQKFANKNREYIKSQLDKNIAISQIAQDLGVSRYYITKTIAIGDEVIENAIKEYHERISKIAKENKESHKNQGSIYLPYINENDWHEITGYDGYYISRYGELCRYLKDYDEYRILSQEENCRSGYIYTAVDDKNLAVHRLVAIYFVPGRTDVKNTVNHIDGNKKNNRWDNLEWCSQSENNKWAYRLGRNPSVAKNDIKEIIVDGKYKFKTITAMAKFLNVSWTQAGRYIRGECKCSRSLEIIRNCID